MQPPFIDTADSVLQRGVALQQHIMESSVLAGNLARIQGYFNLIRRLQYIQTGDPHMNDLQGLSYGLNVSIFDLHPCQPTVLDPGSSRSNIVCVSYVIPTMFFKTRFLGDLLSVTSPFDKTSQLLELHTSFVGFLFSPGRPTLLKQSSDFNLQIFQMRKSKRFRLR